jgi:hypothetical protein
MKGIQIHVSFGIIMPMIARKYLAVHHIQMEDQVMIPAYGVGGVWRGAEVLT